MNTYAFTFHQAALCALPSGGLYWPSERMLIVSDLHLGKSVRAARWGGAQLPPYETRETLARLDGDVQFTQATHVLCLGDSFDARGLDQALPSSDLERLAQLQSNRRWTWIEGNHDPGPLSLAGEHAVDAQIGPLRFRHIAGDAPNGELSGHYHPKAHVPVRGRVLHKPCFLVDERRLILPAYGAYTGGLAWDAPELRALMQPNAYAILTGARPCAVPVPLARARRA